nr:MAG TPA: hypothetical protein [Caudoviricetes sp.]
MRWHCEEIFSLVRTQILKGLMQNGSYCNRICNL